MSAETICRVMGGDISLCRQIEHNHLAWMSLDGGEAIQKALLKPVVYKEEEVSNRVRECSVRDALASFVGGEIEVRTPSGDIDVLSDTEVIEVKYYRQWKGGVGQVLAYGSHFPLLAKRLHLFAHAGDVDTQKYFELEKSVCDAHKVEVTFEEVALVEAEEIVLDDDDDTTVNGDEVGARRVKRARDEIEWNQLDSLKVRKCVAVLESEIAWSIVDRKRAVLEEAKLDAMIADIV